MLILSSRNISTRYLLCHVVCTYENLIIPKLTKRNHDLEHKLTAEEAVKTELIKKNDQVK